jgi:hypothetical protein
LGGEGHGGCRQEGGEEECFEHRAGMVITDYFLNA